MTQDKSTDLRNAVKVVIDAHEGEERINPAWVATEVMTKLGATDLRQSNPLVYLAAHLHLRQVARHVCRKRFDANDDDALDPAQQELFPGLQSRYPAANADGEEPSYILRDAMSAKDVTFNVTRLRLEGRTKLGRADALDAWWRTKIRKATDAIPPAA
jgi:hypothetical protein